MYLYTICKSCLHFSHRHKSISNSPTSYPTAHRAGWNLQAQKWDLSTKNIRHFIKSDVKRPQKKQSISNKHSLQQTPCWLSNSKKNRIKETSYFTVEWIHKTFTLSCTLVPLPSCLSLYVPLTMSYPLLSPNSYLYPFLVFVSSSKKILVLSVSRYLYISLLSISNI